MSNVSDHVWDEDTQTNFVKGVGGNVLLKTCPNCQWNVMILLKPDGSGQTVSHWGPGVGFETIRKTWWTSVGNVQVKSKAKEKEKDPEWEEGIPSDGSDQVQK
jgi:hypothetical protein